MARHRLSPRWSWARPVVGAAILAVLVWRFGAEAFLAPVRRLDAASVAAAAALAALATGCAAWRWRLVSAGLGSELPLRAAVGAYYRSQFLNLVLPGGVLGDVHRAVWRGHDLGDLPHAARAVVAERCAGQLVQVGMTAVALLVLPSPVGHLLPALVLAALAVAGAAIAARTVRGRRSSDCGHWVDRARAVIGPSPDRRWWFRSGPVVVTASAVAVGAHAATFVLAARVAGSSAPFEQLVGLAFLVLLAMAVPLNVAGWGPREGAAAWAFAAAGLGAGVGVGTAVVYGALALAGALPGGLLLAGSMLRPGRSTPGGTRDQATGPERSTAKPPLLAGSRTAHG